MMADRSEDADLRLMALAILWEVELEQAAEELRMLLLAGATPQQVVASMRRSPVL